MDTVRFQQIQQESAALKKVGSLANKSDDELKQLLSNVNGAFNGLLQELKDMGDDFIPQDDKHTIFQEVTKTSNSKVLVLQKIVKELNSRPNVSPKYCVKVHTDRFSGRYSFPEKQICLSTTGVKLFMNSCNGNTVYRCLYCILPLNDVFKCEHCGILTHWGRRIVKLTNNSNKMMIVCTNCYHTLCNQDAYMSSYDHIHHIEATRQAQAQAQPDPQAQMNSAANDNDEAKQDSS